MQSLSQVTPTSAKAKRLHLFYLKHGQSQNGHGSGAQPDQEHVWMGDTHLMAPIKMPTHVSTGTKVCTTSSSSLVIPAAPSLVTVP
jgi:hypothetical protein